MALLSDLTTLCAEHRVDSFSTLHLFARRLREEGRLSQKGRGRGAAHMTFLDAARFLIACAATDHPEKAVDAEYVSSNLIWFGEDYSNASQFIETKFSQDTTPTLDTGVAQLLKIIADGSLDSAQRECDRARSPSQTIHILPSSSVIVHRSIVNALIHIHNVTFYYQHPTLAAVISAPDYFAQQPLIAALDREAFRFRTGKNLRAELSDGLLRAVANLIGGAASDGP